MQINVHQHLKSDLNNRYHRYAAGNKLKSIKLPDNSV